MLNIQNSSNESCFLHLYIIEQSLFNIICNGANFAKIIVTNDLPDNQNKRKVSFIKNVENEQFVSAPDLLSKDKSKLLVDLNMPIEDIVHELRKNKILEYDGNMEVYRVW